MMKFAWENYKRYAWGKNELRPLTKNGHIGNMFGEFWGFSYAFSCQEMSGLDAIAAKLYLYLRDVLTEEQLKNNPHFSNKT